MRTSRSNASRPDAFHGRKHRPKNPLDLGIPMGSNMRRVCEVVAKDQRRHDRLGAMLPSRLAPGSVEALQNLLKNTDKPIIARPHELSDDPQAVEAQKSAGFPFVQGWSRRCAP